MRIITVVLLIGFAFAFSCVIEGPYPKPDCWVIVTNGGFFLMDVLVEEVDTEEIVHKDVQVGETKTWDLFLTGLPSCDPEPFNVYIRATYKEPSLTDGGLFEEGYDTRESKSKEIIITDCPGWY